MPSNCWSFPTAGGGGDSCHEVAKQKSLVAEPDAPRPPAVLPSPHGVLPIAHAMVPAMPPPWASLIVPPTAPPPEIASRGRPYLAYLVRPSAQRAAAHGARGLTSPRAAP